MVSIGTIVWLSSELMFFAALFAMYFTLRSVNPELWAEEVELLNIPFSSVNTTVLVLSSVTCQLGVFAAERGDVKGLRKWFVITFIMGFYFVAGQVYEYTILVHEGLTLSSSAYGSAFYLTTGFHGLRCRDDDGFSGSCFSGLDRDVLRSAGSFATAVVRDAHGRWTARVAAGPCGRCAD